MCRLCSLALNEDDAFPISSSLSRLRGSSLSESTGSSPLAALSSLSLHVQGGAGAGTDGLVDGLGGEDIVKL